MATLRRGASIRSVLLASSALAFGTAIAAAQTAITQGSSPTPYNDGLANAPAGAPLLPTLLNGYATTPPWNVAGVNYAVAVPSGTALQDPSVISTAGVLVNASAHTVTVTGSNISLSGYDFSQGGGWSVQVAPGANNTTISNDNFAVGANGKVPVNAATGSGSLTVTNSMFNGGPTANGNSNVWAMINYNGTGTFNARYNAFLNAPADAIDFNVGKMTTNVTYNVFENLGTSPGSHPDPVQYVGVNSDNSTIAYNTIYQPYPSGMQGVQVQAQNGSTLTNTAIANNTIVAKGPSLGMSYSVAVIQNTGNTINGATVANNYIDTSGAYGAFYPPSGSNLSFGGNVDLSTGQTLPNPSGTTSEPNDTAGVTSAPLPSGQSSTGSSSGTTSVVSPSPGGASPMTTAGTGSTASNALPAASAVTTGTPSAGGSAIACATSQPGSTGQQGAVLLGTEIGDPLSSNGTSNYASFTAAMGRAPAMVDTYIDDTVPPSQWAASASYSASGIASTNTIPVVGIPMAITGDNADTDFKAIASGAWDSALNGVFQQYANAGQKTIIIRPGWEMNGNWYPWSVTPSNASDFVSAFQRIANVAHSFGGANVKVVWNPGYVTSSTSYQSIYPGNQYVDSIGIDTYGAGSGVPSTAPLDTSTNPNNFTLQDAIALAKASGKPLSLPETGAGPGDTVFPANLASVIAASGVPVSFVNIWDDHSGGQSDLHWSDNAASVAAWKQAFATISGGNGGTACSSLFGSDSSRPAAADIAPTVNTDPIDTTAVGNGAQPGSASATPAASAATVSMGPAPTTTVASNDPVSSSHVSSGTAQDVVPTYGAGGSGSQAQESASSLPSSSSSSSSSSNPSGDPTFLAAHDNPQRVVPKYGAGYVTGYASGDGTQINNGNGDAGGTTTTQPDTTTGVMQTNYTTTISTDPADTPQLQALMAQSYGQTAVSTADQLGVNPSSVAAIAQVESNFRNVGTANGSTTATGPWQFTQGTFNAVSQNNNLGLTPSDLTNPNAQATEAPYYLQQIASTISTDTGKPATTLQTYAGWVFGPDAGAQIAAASDNAPLSSIVSARSLANNGMSDWTVGRFNSAMSAKLGTAANQTVLTT